MKYIFITGGNLSALGKGITSATIGSLLKARKWDVSVVKVDPYLNVDAGTMSPYQHGEVYVTKDGAETDLDLGHYERFLDINLEQKKQHNSRQSLQKSSRKGKAWRVFRRYSPGHTACN